MESKSRLQPHLDALRSSKLHPADYVLLSAKILFNKLQHDASCKPLFESIRTAFSEEKYEQAIKMIQQLNASLKQPVNQITYAVITAENNKTNHSHTKVKFNEYLAEYPTPYKNKDHIKHAFDKAIIYSTHTHLLAIINQVNMKSGLFACKETTKQSNTPPRPDA